MSETSYRTILRSSAIIGSAQLINVAVNILKIKILAALLGPIGVGLIGLYSSIVQTGSTIASVGFGTVGTRQIAAANAEGDDILLNRVRKALFLGTMGFALAGAAGIWFARTAIASAVFDDAGRAGEVGWLALGVALTVAAGSQSALLTGLRRLGDFARLQVISSLAAAVFGVAAIWFWGANGVIAMVLLAPAASFVMGHVFVRRLPKATTTTATLTEVSGEIRKMVALGMAVMLSTLALVAGQLLVRVIVQQELGGVALGYFQAAWAISMTYLGFVLGAMGTDYFPRLSAVIASPEKATRLVNEQTEIGLLLCGPVLVALLGLAPWVIALLYTSDFAPAVDVLRWQLLGDILKVMSWPLGFVLLALRAGKTFAFAEFMAVAVFLGGTALGVPTVGLVATGMAFFAMYVAYIPLVYWLCRRRIQFKWSRAVILQALAVMTAAALVFATAVWSEIGAAALAIVLASSLGLWALLRISEMAQLTGKLGRLAAFSKKLRILALLRR